MFFDGNRNVSQIRLWLSWVLLFGTLFMISCADDENEVEPISTDQVNDVASLSSLFLQYDGVLSTNSDADHFFVNSNGIANHRMMVGITVSDDRVVVPHNYDSWAIPLRPEISSEEISLETDLREGAVAIAINGVPIFNPIGEDGRILNDTGELDEFGGQAGVDDDYHYHIAPLHLQTSDNNPIAFALDGFPIYGTRESDGSMVQPLDDFNGHFHDDGEYHYHALEEFPFIFEKFRGKVTLSGSSPITKIASQPVADGFRPESQIRAFLSQFADSGGGIITDMVQNENEMGYSLFYEVNGEQGSVVYFWDIDGFYTFEYNDPDGTITSQVFERIELGI
ncbi:MAG: YHYH protein [Bacteroidota bacterium]